MKSNAPRQQRQQRQQILLSLLFLTCAFSCQMYIASKSTQIGHISLQIFPERLRGFFAARLWERADKLMHAGPSKKLAEDFRAGSYIGNTEILPLLQMIIYISPEETAPRLLLAENLGKFLGRKDEAIKILQQGIIENPKLENIYELYATIAMIKIFTENSDPEEKNSALKYLYAAIKNYNSDTKKIPLHGHSLKTYEILAARLHVELNQPDEALDAWIKSGISLDTDTSQLAKVIRKYRDTGLLDKITNPVEPDTQNTYLAEEAKHKITDKSHDHCDSHDYKTHSAMPRSAAYWNRLPWLTAWLILLLIFFCKGQRE